MISRLFDHESTFQMSDWLLKNEWLGLICLIKRIVIHSDTVTYPLHLSKSEGLKLNVFNSHQSNARECVTSLVKKQNIVPHGKNYGGNQV